MTGTLDPKATLRANSKLKSSEYSMPVLGLIFLRYADYKFEQVEKELASKAISRRTNRYFPAIHLFHC
jgi:type I restriction enzyme M protein